jgi:hydrogenase nickel incorporation protein HypA/HybF
LAGGLTLHELSLAESVLQIIENAAQDQEFSQVKTVWLEIGLLACVQQESLRFHFEVVTRNTVAHQAQLKIIEVSGQGWCDQCDCEVPLTTPYDRCSHCGHYALQVIRGEEMRVKKLEVI